MWWHLHIIVVLLSNPIDTQLETVNRTFETENLCKTAGQERIDQLNQDKNQAAGFVCIKF